MRATGWIVVQAKRRTYGVRPDGTYPVDRVALKPGLWKSKPTVEADEEAVEIEIEFSDGYFDHNSPKVVVHVPDDLSDATPIVTTARVTKGRKPSAAAAVIRQANP